MKFLIKKRMLRVISFLLLGFIIIQFIQPHIENPPVTGDIAAPLEVKIVLKKACFDCHSNETQLRWFDRISPVSWIVAKDIEAGRSAVNFSEWNNLPVAQQKDKFWQIVNFAISGVMPLKQYTRMHPAAKLSEGDQAILKNYVSGMASPGTYDTSKTMEAFEQFNQWQKGVGNTSIPVASNGVAYDPDYKNWQSISTTDAFSNGTMRVIVGNAVAIKAIKENNIRHWPDGSVLAKIQWDQLADKEGNIYPGKFNQVEFMVKDSRKYAATEGWGWARFKTIDLVPDDKDARFASKCISCHRPVKDLDHVFTFPVKL
ncbi:heme-binding domain-containing protein [Flavihumibacter profundi]|uniref:heme-binding domain-containing protein n=1 Tax=Flavihumibacter profundi TaxID=2716883 RepID=UPI001CC7C7A4|nr:heme-binding domain-containing protein [Flavihumibacter profundi]MBZ5859410.1 heme-binding domain-containing protein [Flavihumibacter profundi]